MKVINPKSWLILIAFISVAIAAIIWSIFGYIPIAMEVKGQLVNGAVELIESSELGILEDLQVKKGDKVEQGQIIAKIETRDTQGRSQTQEVISHVSGRVLSTVALGTIIEPKTHLAIIEKDDSLSQKTIFCLSSPEQCQKIKPGMKVQITASDLQKKFDATVKDVSPLLMVESNPTNLLGKATLDNSSIPQTHSVTIQSLQNIQIDKSTKDNLEKYPSYLISMQVIEKHSPISFILPKS
ncbi:MAG: biotin/lipoyl-binding protein [Richelia sp. SM1_7_0]|nr:biotin/lipoyl-binding protein [Richelia sp. SM1_7_0]